MPPVPPAQDWARSCWAAAEPFTLGLLFAPEAREAAHEVGLSGLKGFLALRAAPLGEAAPAVVMAAFHGFPYATLAAVFPDCWRTLTPEQVIELSHSSVSTACDRLLASHAAPVPRLADALTEVVGGLDTSGRPLGAGNQAVRPPDEPWARLWRAMTTLREFRGDGHVATLTSAGLDRVEALVLMSAWGAAHVDAVMLRRTRQLDDETWGAAVGRLQDRGLLEQDGVLTAAGQDLREGIEEATDRAAAAPWRAMGGELVTEFWNVSLGLSTAVLEAGIMPAVTAVGAPWPPARAAG